CEAASRAPTFPGCLRSVRDSAWISSEVSSYAFSVQHWLGLLFPHFLPVLDSLTPLPRVSHGSRRSCARRSFPLIGTCYGS
ncbi:hypothetical protein PENTCL1PPCAC_13896, partial [Pristionchus entomophagus]